MTEQDHLDFWTKSSNLPDFQVVHVRRDPLRLTVVPAMPLALRSSCCRAMDYVHRALDSRPANDLSIGPQTFVLIVLTYQFYCQCCSSYFTPRCPALTYASIVADCFLKFSEKLAQLKNDRFARV
jgi:hypothetical protein